MIHGLEAEHVMTVDRAIEVLEEIQNEICENDKYVALQIAIDKLQNKKIIKYFKKLEEV